jgi:hypothetical protein
MMEFIVTHDGKNWIAKNEVLHVEALTLEALDNQLKKRLKAEGYLEEGGKLDIFMAFDNATIPQWMRQYSQHYFNRIVQLED